MKRITIILIIVIIPFIFSGVSIAQKSKFKPGDISKEELLLQTCELDSNARAVILCDIGKVTFDYSNNIGFQLVFDRYIRVKIFKNTGYDWADFSIPLYQSGADKEKITRLKGVTYNLENGKISKDKLKNGDVYSEETSKHWEHEKFSMPQVKEGSVIEIEYTVASDFFFNLNSWYFQHDIPTIWSEYTVVIPEWLKYKKEMRGYIPIFESTSEITFDQKVPEV